MKLIFTLLGVFLVSCQSITSLPMVFVDGGSFIMGNDQFGIPEHEKTVESFYICQYEVTIKDWTKFINSETIDFEWNNEYWGDIWDYSESEMAPIQYVQWWQAIFYCNWLSEQDGFEPAYIVHSQNDVTWNKNANGYRLPTEAEWEYAARGGNSNRGYIYSGSNDPFKVGWFKENAKDISKNVGTKEPNEIGLYDMSGNMSEWVWETYYWELTDIMKRKNLDPLNYHVTKGGNARALSERVPIFHRGSFLYNGKGLVGFRIVRNAE